MTGPNDEPPPRTVLADAVRRVEALLHYLPDGVASDMRTRLGVLRGIVLEQRAPALVLVGRRGAGKSSLVNALFGAKVAEVGHVKSQTGRGRWFEYTTDAGTLAILDSRGVQEGSAPAEADDARTAVASILEPLRERAPDAVVFLVKATEVDAALEGDLAALERVMRGVEREHRFRPPIVAVATHCDLLEPKRTRLHAPDDEPPEDLEEKLDRVAEVERLLAGHLSSRPPLAPHVVKTLGVSTYVSWREGGGVRDDERWRIDALSSTLFQALPDAGRGVFVRIARVKGLQEELATNLTRTVATVCAAVAALPIPVADLVPLTALQVSLVAGIAWIGGRTLSTRAAAEFLGAVGVNVGVAFALREGARALVKYVLPGAGSAVSGAVAFAGTMAIGAAARAYFIRGESLASAKRIREDGG